MSDGALFNECRKHLIAFTASPFTLQYKVDAVDSAQCTPAFESPLTKKTKISTPKKNL